MTLRRTLAAATLALILAAPASAQPKDNFLKTNPQLMATLSSVIARPTEYTVKVVAGDKDLSLGTVVGADGWVLAKFSELKANPIVVLKDGRKLPAMVVGYHQPTDLAMLKVDAKNLPFAEWRDSKEDGVGSWVISPGVGKEPVAVGVISVMARSGGRVMPSENSGYLGVQMEQTPDGVKVKDVLPSTAASKAGIKVDDLILQIDEVVIKEIEVMMETLAKKKAGDKAVIKIKRDGKPMEFAVELGKRPANPNARGDFQNRMGSTLSDRRNGFPTILQHDTVLKPNECGGPLVDLDGKVVGINIARAGRTESYAIPSEFVRTLLPDLQGGKYPAPKLEPVVTTAAKEKELEEALKKLDEEIGDREKKKKAIQDELKKLREQRK